ncbi:MAG: hypothetical protein DRQ48_01885 [Gammaproteobacteria bacterium]|nr:MAG: hypothetical protein DRQ48_01885 [Gammaproteobacteria bacterium]
MDKIKKGDQLKCHWSSGYSLTREKVYIALGDQLKGHFASNPYITVSDDDGDKVTCFVGRFTRL